MNETLTNRLLARLGQSEDPWVERKASFHERDVRRTLVAFANSVNEDQTAVLFIGASNDGRHPGLLDADDTQKKLGGVATERCYPPIAYQTCVLTVEVDSKEVEVLAVTVPFSKRRPHFGGMAYVRRGSESIEASKEVFQELIASQNDKARKLLQHKGKSVVLRFQSDSGFRYDLEGTIGYCDAHTLRLNDQEGSPWSLDVEQVIICEDAQAGMVVTVRPRWTDEQQIREIIRRWCRFAAHSKLAWRSLDKHHPLLDQLLANPEKTINAAGASADGAGDPYQKFLLANLRFELKKIQRPMTREQKLDFLVGAQRIAAEKAVASGLSHGTGAKHMAEVDAVAQIATSIDEVDEFLDHVTKGQSPHIRQGQKATLYRKLGLPEE